MKSWCKGCEVDQTAVLLAFEDWASHTSGHKNRWRVEAEHGSAAGLVEEIATEVRERRLTFRPMRSYRHRERGKERLITVESVKQQVCDYVAVRALTPMLEAYLRDAFGLSLHAWQVCRVGPDEPVDVAGYVVRPDKTTLRASAFLRMDRARRRFRRRPTARRARSLVSHWGQLLHTDSRAYRRRRDVDRTMGAARRVISLDARREGAVA